MSNSSKGGEPSMEEILASIRALVSQDPPQTSAQPASPQSSQQQHKQPVEPFAGSNSAMPAHDKPAPSVGGGPELSSSPPIAPPAPGRLDEDDLADLLDEPLPAVDRSVSPPTATPAIAAGAGRSTDSAGPAAAPMHFDFGAMVPSRDPAPKGDFAGAPLPSLSNSPPTVSSPAGTAASGTLSADWSQGAHAAQNSAPEVNGNASENPAPSLNSERASPAVPVAKATANGAEPPAKKPHDGPATEVTAHAPGNSPAAQSGPGKYFSAPVTGGSSLASFSSRPLVSPSDESTPAALAQPGSEKRAGEAATPASGREGRSFPTPSFMTRMAGAAHGPAKESVPAAYPSIEPVLKAFGKTEPNLDRTATASTPAPEPRLGRVNAPEGAAQDSSNVSGTAPTAAPKQSKSNGNGGQDQLGERTLEDAVMHLLRPMLREWLDDNLPRIVEDAVRREIAEAVKSKIGQVPKL